MNNIEKRARELLVASMSRTDNRRPALVHTDDALHAIIAALSAAPQVPEGWVLVPVELTDDMAIAFAEVWFTKRRPIDDPEMEDCYAAMLAAKPEPPK